ncbi:MULTISPECIES: sugar ABC transporter ATP-binding protein [Congzhengia]|uniref:Sugar ABC transporter ATP-binding protein n=1 Tax=Congzhengia minquanensis TaxID=2763657 RepID=A0A926DLM4_9FIRM|nr:sugar ABC transporter ATP-binding protein [Congzhengia minquanensis]MBC8541238.1 sugar ABC transporter ATP-binding protein [Congzhengia minquanensis]
MGVMLEMTGIEKRFPGVHALKNCHFDLKKGEIHALIGENGAGKSTLMKILTGVYGKDGGTILYNGEEINVTTPKEAQNLGISIIHQELNLMPDLTAAQNIFIGREATKLGGLYLSESKQNRAAKSLFELLNLDLDPKTKVRDVTVAKQQMIEIAKALSFNSKILIMDEPTAALTESEIRELFKIIAGLKEQGVGIVYISHRMEELFEISDRITVMRDGEYIATKTTAETSMDEIIRLMVGRTIYEPPKEASHVKGNDVVLEVKNLNAGKEVKDVSFSLRRGEILGFAGLMGAGRTETARAVFGADKIDSGEIFINGKKAHIRSPKDAVKHGIGYLSEDRKQFGLALGMNIEANTVLANYENFNTGGIVNDKKAAEAAKKYVDMLKTKTPSTKQLVGNLSGGNQQKVVIAKWLCRDCDILIFDEPTRGIDVGAKSEIYKLLTDLAEQGKSIIMISSELPEILRMSDRVVVMCEGRITGTLDISEADQEKIMKYATMRQ